GHEAPCDSPRNSAVHPDRPQRIQRIGADCHHRLGDHRRRRGCRQRDQFGALQRRDSDGIRLHDLDRHSWPHHRLAGEPAESLDAALATGERGPAMKRPMQLLLLEVVSPIAIVAALWAWSARAGSFFFPPLSSIFKAFNTVWLGPGLLNDAVPSLSRWAAAYTIAVLLGVAIGVPLGLSPVARRLLGPVIE